MNELRDYEMMLSARKLLDDFFDRERGHDLSKDWSNKCYEIADVIRHIDEYLEEKEK